MVLFVMVVFGDGKKFNFVNVLFYYVKCGYDWNVLVWRIEKKDMGVLKKIFEFDLWWKGLFNFLYFSLFIEVFFYCVKIEVRIVRNVFMCKF